MLEAKVSILHYEDITYKKGRDHVLAPLAEQERGT